MATCPTPPAIPQEVLMRFRTMRDYDKAMRQFAAALCAFVASGIDLTDILNRLDALEAAGSVAPADCCADLYAHIAATVVHGTTSNVVGESDVQSLDNKTIGFTNPGYGRFTHVIQSNEIPVADTLYVPFFHNMVNAGTYSIAGTLIVDGVAAFI